MEFSLTPKVPSRSLPVGWFKISLGSSTPSLTGSLDMTAARELDLPPAEVVDHQDDEMSWELLNKIIHEVFTAADGQIERVRGHAGQHSIFHGDKEMRSHSTKTTSDKTTDGAETRKPQCLQGVRRPQKDDEYWSVSPSAWSRLSQARQEVLSHVGRINETAEGVQAPDGDCSRCAQSGAECMVYRSEARIVTSGDQVLCCSRCRFRGLVCSRRETVKPRGRKRKAVRFGASVCDEGYKPTSRTKKRAKTRC